MIKWRPWLNKHQIWVISCTVLCDYQITVEKNLESSLLLFLTPPPSPHKKKTKKKNFPFNEALQKLAWDISLIKTYDLHTKNNVLILNRKSNKPLKSKLYFSTTELNEVKSSIEYNSPTLDCGKVIR